MEDSSWKRRKVSFIYDDYFLCVAIIILDVQETFAESEGAVVKFDGRTSKDIVYC